MVKKSIVFLAILLIGLNALAVNPKSYIKKGNIPIHITADKLTAFDKKGLYIFEGGVVATRGDVRLTSDKMEVYKDKKTGDIGKVVCIGHVVITKQDKKATGDKAIYTASDSKVVLIGHAKVVSGKNNITSDRIIYYLDRDYVVSQSDNKTKRVEVIIYPNQKKGSK
ncbi:lipopolysaccharide transport periplasmic protein LptA [Hippea maritima]|uniref:Lipopolysaccharide transport periplasmic protein LptA n=1 Tax=Hippea maritima (strain ATCC 700847 / DSM 10411 / MH2) TaxID=760142 RepID=F2LUT0_HIPMA|nr:lipopolysaccharide transport periplasmic protein LptA [Hippea maritima]AEA33535.1 lipopolysaccharide transport periplasmic protein LptA [Hippea maritima DSM 10411]